MPAHYILKSAMSQSIRLCTKNVKFALIVWACLAYAVKHHNASVRIPVKTVQAIFGTAFNASTAKSLKAIQWADADGNERTVFTAVEHTKNQAWWVSFNAVLLDTARHLASDDFYLNIFSGLPDIARGTIQMAIGELEGVLPSLTAEGLRTILYRTIQIQQTPTGSTVSIKPKSCPLCASREISTIFYDSPEAMHDYLKKNQRGRSMVSVGNGSFSKPKPRWECHGCGIKFWAPADGREA